VLTLVIGSAHGTVVPAANHYGTLRGLEEDYGVGLLGQSADSNVGDILPLLTARPWVAGYGLSATATSWTTNQSQTYSVTITNTGTQIWPAGGANPVHLGVHFANTGGGAGSNTWYGDQRFSPPAD
jgi:hypothetical protein